ncbi:MAG: single-stranded DNA-binding protein [Cyclobacteriaceae bacterium]
MKNRVQLIGNLGAAPEVRNLNSGKKVAQFSLATSESYKNAAGERVQETQWHQVVAWNKLADIAESYLDRGRRVAVEGKLVYRSYEDKNGVKRYVTEIVATDILMLDKKDKEPEAEVAETAESYDELPF